MKKRSIGIICLFVGMAFIFVPNVSKGVAPTITMNGATPTTASWISNIDFFLNYTDADDDAPDFTPLVEIDGTNRTMIANDSTDTTYTDGKFYFYEENQFWNTTHSFRFWVGDGTTNVSSVAQQFTIDSQRIINITGSSEDGTVACLHAVYNNCLDYPGANYLVESLIYGASGEFLLITYTIDQFFLSFDTSMLPDDASINYATLYLETWQDHSTVDFNSYVYHNATNTTGWWDKSSNLAVTDYVPQSSVAGMTLDGNILNSSHYADESYFGVNVVASYIDTDEKTRYVVLGDNYGRAPTSDERIWWHGTGSLQTTTLPYLLIDYNSPNAIDIKNPDEGDTVFNTIDIISKVTSSNEIEEVTYYLNSLYHVAVYDSASLTYIYREYNTKALSNGYHSIVARVNFTNGEYATDEIQIRVQNVEGKDCWWDDFLKLWICPNIRTFVPHRLLEKGDYEMTKGTEQTYWTMIYTYIEESTDSTSHALYAPLDSSTYTDNNVIWDWIFIDDYDVSNRVYVNDTKSTASTADDTELENDTYQSIVSISGQNVTVNCSVNTDAERYAKIFIALDFEWSYNTATDLYTYSWTFTSNLASTMEDISVYIPFELEADVESVEVWDLSSNIQLDAGKDYDVSGAGVYVGITSLTSSSSKTLTITFSPYVTGTDILKPTITVQSGDVQDEPSLINGEWKNLAIKDAFNSNNFDYSGITIADWDAGSIDWNSLEIQDSDGSTYDWYPELGKIIIKDTSYDRHTYKTFYFYYESPIDDPVIDWLTILAPILAFMFILFGILSAIAYITTKDNDRKDKMRTLMYICLFLGGILLFGLIFLPIFV